MSKLFTFLALVCLFAACNNRSNQLLIPANDTLIVQRGPSDGYVASIKNASNKPIEVAIKNKVSGERMSSFGLPARASQKVNVNKNGVLSMVNRTNTPVKIYVTKEAFAISDEEIQENGKIESSQVINFSLQNKSAASIPLLIPSVMNPNLSPFSMSGVSLKIGQKVFFRNNGKKYLLLEVDRSISEGSVLEVSQLLKDRRKELGLN